MDMRTTRQVTRAASALAASALGAACGAHNGLEIDVSGAGSANTVMALIVPDHTCMIGDKACTDVSVGPGVSLDGGSAVTGDMSEIGSAVSADVHHGAATFLLETDKQPLPYNVWRIAVISLDANNAPLSAYVLEQVQITSPHQQISINLATSDASVVAFATDATGGPLPCVGVTVHGASEREYYLPANNHDCDAYPVGTLECDDLFANYKSTSATTCLGIGPPGAGSSGSSLPGSCVPGTGTCDDGTGSKCTTPQSYGSGTECLPIAVCHACSQPSCIGSALAGLGSSDVMTCNFELDSSGNVCGANGATSYAVSPFSTACTSASVDSVVALGSASAVTSVIAGGWQVPLAVTGCAFAFGSGSGSVATATGSANGTYVVEAVIGGVQVVIPLTVTVHAETATTGCATISSSCTLPNNGLSAIYGACAGG
jgi:hypothetical protein